MAERRTLRLILGDQLNLNHSWFRKTDPNIFYCMMEVRQETDYTLHHIQKITAFLTAMREFSGELIRQGHKVLYITLDDPENAQSIPENCSRIIQKFSITRFEYLLPDELRVDLQLREFAENLSIPFECSDTEHFLTRREDVQDFFRNRKTYLMEPFYRHLRKKHSILMTEEGKPVSGRWNFDKENRNPLPAGTAVPAPLVFKRDVREVHRTIKSAGVKTFGSIDPLDFQWPVTRKESLLLLEHFLKHSIQNFGTYQDAMVQDNPYLFHARISFSLNSKLISPGEVIAKTLDFWNTAGGSEAVSAAQIEGFIRQILGWREYVRGVYWAEMPAYGDLNFFNHTAELPDFYWTGKTAMNCMKRTITDSLKNAYAHHIQRLMVSGNFALLTGVNPDEVDRWYLGIYIDALQWVELPNTRGMSQFADGGILGSKPYVSTAAYINRMSDYCRNCGYKHSKRYGENACPFNSLYWAFYLRHQQKLRGQPRIGFVYKNLDRMDEEEKSNIINQAYKYLSYRNDL